VGGMEYDEDFVLIECELEPLKAYVERLESEREIAVIKEPSICLTLLKAEDSLEKQPFYLGEALVTECEVAVDGNPGYGLCLGEEPTRSYCLAALDAILRGRLDGVEEVEAFIQAQREPLRRRDREAFARSLRTQVDFKLMEQD